MEFISSFGGGKREKEIGVGEGGGCQDRAQSWSWINNSNIGTIEKHMQPTGRGLICNVVFLWAELHSGTPWMVIQAL